MAQVGSMARWPMMRLLPYQALHSDLGAHRVPPGQRKDWPPPKMAVNFAVHDILFGDFGPMRVVPRRKLISNDEPEEMRESKLFPLNVGAAVIRDLRLWHGGTPNVSGLTRLFPNVELHSASYAEFLDAAHSFDQSPEAHLQR